MVTTDSLYRSLYDVQRLNLLDWSTVTTLLTDRGRNAAARTFAVFEMLAEKFCEHRPSGRTHVGGADGQRACLPWMHDADTDGQRAYLVLENVLMAR